MAYSLATYTAWWRPTAAHLHTLKAKKDKPPPRLITTTNIDKTAFLFLRFASPTKATFPESLTGFPASFAQVFQYDMRTAKVNTVSTQILSSLGKGGAPRVVTRGESSS
jgi:hypothetical protein